MNTQERSFIDVLSEAQDQRDAAEALLDEVEVFFDSLPVQTKAKWDLGQILAKRNSVRSARPPDEIDEDYRYSFERPAGDTLGVIGDE